MTATQDLPVEPQPSAMPSGSVPGSGDGTPSPRPLSYSNIYAEDLHDLPVECWDDDKQRRFVILERRPILTDNTMCGFTARWVDEDRVQNITLWARRFVKVIGAYDYPRSHPEAAKFDPGPEYPGSGRLRAARWDR